MPNGPTGLVMTVVGGVAILAIAGAVVGYGDDREQDAQIEDLIEEVDDHEEQIRELRDASLRTEGRLINIDEKIGAIAVAVEKIADKVE